MILFLGLADTTDDEGDSTLGSDDLVDLEAVAVEVEVQVISYIIEMKIIAFVHDRLYYIAGAEQVFFQMISKTLNDLDYDKKQHRLIIYTMFSDKKELILQYNAKDITIPIVTALPRRIFSLFVYFDKHKIFFLSKLLDYRNLMFFYPLLTRALKQKIKTHNPIYVYISSFAVAKNIAPAIQSSNSNAIKL